MVRGGGRAAVVLVVADTKLGNVREIEDFTLDVAFGADENALTLTVEEKSAPAAGQLVYIDATEYGGVIDQVKRGSGRGATGTVECKGRTWHGILAGRRLSPDSGSGYLTVNGKVGDVLTSLIARMGLESLFKAASDDSTVSYTFSRFCDGYSGLMSCAKANGRKLAIRRMDGYIELSMPPIVDYANKVDSDLLDFTITSVHRCVNHLLCAGTGQLENRAIVHFYADENGNVSHKQTLFGIDEICALYDYSNASISELETEGKKKLLEYQTSGTVEVDAHEDMDVDVGDIISARDNSTGTTVTATVSKKVVKVNNGVATYSYEVGSDTTTKTSSTGAAESSGGGGHAYLAGKGLTLDNYTFNADVDASDISSISTKVEEARTEASNALAAAGKAEERANAANDAAAANAQAIAANATAISTKQDALIAGKNITLDGAKISATDTTYSNATQESSGLMSAVDKALLDGIKTGATVAKSAETAKGFDSARTVAITGAVNGSATWDGSSDLSITVEGDSAAASFLAAHPVGFYVETSGANPNNFGGTWTRQPSIGPNTWLRTK